MKSLLAALLIVPALALAADPPKATPKPARAPAWQAFNNPVEPNEDFEICMKVAKGETRRYHWKSDGAVDFNIHHHRGNEVLYPVKRTGMRADGGSFTAREADDYCWMWTAKKARAKVEGRVEVDRNAR